MGKTDWCISEGNGKVSCVIKNFPLSSGQYSYKIYASNMNETLDMLDDAGSFSVLSGDYYGTGKLPPTNRPSVLIYFDYNQINFDQIILAV